MPCILHIIPRLRKGGAERLCLDICKQLQKHEGVRVRLITFSDENQYTFLTKDIDWQVISTSVQLSVFHKNEIDIAALQKAIDDFAPDVIHTHLFEAELVSRSCYYPKAKWFSHCHDNMRQFRFFDVTTLFNKQLLTNFYEKRYLISRYKVNGGNTFIAISHDTERYFHKTAQQFDVQLLPNAIDYEKFHDNKEHQVSSNLRLINIGSLNTNKNQIFLVNVAKILADKGVDFDLKLVGGGQDYDMLKQRIESFGLQKNVSLCGNVDNVEDYLHESDIYVHSSLSEALGLTIIEAMASGLPVVTLDGRGNRDLIVKGKNGNMIYGQNAELFADCILKIWNDKQKYCQMSAFAQDFARQYDIKPYVDKLLELYKSSK